MDGVANEQRTPRYAWYVLFVLFLVYALNFIDRQILTILAPDIRRDLGLSHADIGFLYGTAFGVFYALFGIPLGRLADSWNRVRLLTLGLGWMLYFILWQAIALLYNPGPVLASVQGPLALKAPGDLAVQANWTSLQTSIRVGTSRLKRFSAVTDDLTNRFSAIDLVRVASAALGGQGGGGRPDMAQAGGPDASKADDAIAAVRAALEAA